MNQRAPVDFVLSQPLSETFTCGGTAESVMAAHVMAQAALREVLGADLLSAWVLKAMDHAHVPGVGVEFSAQFVRVPDEQD